SRLERTVPAEHSAKDSLLSLRGPEGQSNPTRQGRGRPRSESALRLTPEIRQSKFPGTPRPSVTLALAAPGPPVQLRWTTLRVQDPALRDAGLANRGRRSP